MAYLAHYKLASYVPQHKMPLWVVKVYRKRQAEKKFHDHQFSEIVLILHGCCEHLCEGKSEPVEAGDLMVVHPGATHAFDKQFEKLQIANILYDSQKLYLPVLDELRIPLFRILFPPRSEVFLSVRPLMRLDPDALKKISGLIDKLDFELKSQLPGHEFYALSIFMEIIVFLGRLYGKQIPEEETTYQIGEILNYMKSHYQESVTVAQLAKRSYMSKRNFYIQFQNATGCSPIQYLIRYRISLAIEMLLHTKIPIGEIATRCGFSSGNYFCKLFHEKTGMSPQCYRLKKTTGKEKRLSDG